MLNKLLKRCMPWQQKGKWVRIYVDWTDTSNPPVVNGPDWLNVSVVDAGHGEYNIKYNPEDFYFMADNKVTVTSEFIPESVIDSTSKIQSIFEFYEFYNKAGYIDMFLYKIDPVIIAG